MQATITNRLSGRVPVWVAIGLALCAAFAVTASPAAGATGTDRPAAGIVLGWKAGPVAPGHRVLDPRRLEAGREVQRGLDRLGYAPGPIDGLFGPRTDGAVRRYQSDRELTADGIVGSETIGSLRARTETARSSNIPAERAANRSRAGAATSAAAASTPAAASPPQRPQVGRSVSKSDGFQGLPSWWMLALIIPLAFSAAVFTALLLVPGRRHCPGSGRRHTASPTAASRPWTGATTRPRVPSMSRAAALDPRVGHFTGFAYWMWPVEGAGNGHAEPTLLVYDASKRGPVSVRAEEVLSVNGQAIEPAGRPRERPSFRWIGARVHVAEETGVDSLPGTLPVHLELFLEDEHQRWDTGSAGGRKPPVHVCRHGRPRGRHRTDGDVGPAARAGRGTRAARRPDGRRGAPPSPGGHRADRRGRVRAGREGGGARGGGLTPR